MEVSVEKKKSSYSMQTVAVQIYDCINNNDERLWNMLEVYKMDSSLCCRRLKVIFLQTRTGMIICVIQRKNMRSIVSAHFQALKTTTGIAATHVQIRGMRYPRYSFATIAMIL